MNNCNSNMYITMQLNELFTDTKQELEETSRELQQTGKQLELTSSALKVTERKLDRTTQERDEHKYLVSVHVKTEEKLHTQATKVTFEYFVLPQFKLFILALTVGVAVYVSYATSRSYNIWILEVSNKVLLDIWCLPCCRCII
jgi:hypothetical protein